MRPATSARSPSRPEATARPPAYDRRHAAARPIRAPPDRPPSSSRSARSRARSRAWAPCSTPRSAATSWSGCSGARVAAALATDGVDRGRRRVARPRGARRSPRSAGARAVVQQSRGLNPALQEARDAIAADRLLIIPADLPAVTPAALAQVLATGDRAGPPERRARARPPRPRDQRAAARPARRHRPGVRRRQPGRPRLARVVGRRRVRRGPRRPRPRRRHARRPAARRGRADPRAATRRSVSTEPPEGRVEIIALAGLPEVREGDDLEAMIGDALEATAGALPFRDGDVLVVTQKVVSKAEGAVADLRDGRRRGRRRSPGPRRGAATRARSRSCCARRGGSCGCRTAC